MGICLICSDREVVYKKTKECKGCYEERRKKEYNVRMERWRKKNGLKSRNETMG